MPLEALRWDVTPIGLHYLLTHYDIPDVDAADWRLSVEGLVERPLTLSLDDLRARPAVEVAVTMECAGNGRVHVEPHVVSQPWLLEAVGTARWRGVAVASLLEEAGVKEGAVEVLFTGLDRGVEGEEEQAYERSLPVGRAPRRGRASRVRGQRRPASAAARLSASPGRPRLVRDDEREVALAHDGARRAVRRLPDAPLLPRAARRRTSRASRSPRSRRARS